ncbi:hypothetical protein JAAARDRAFT_38030 [Jaapia argillacea MUCL 33604]|uniref:BTB domain-containing protein n=1 Tax=Jaapia argillacea MUCL 33604 TaxID=933084 RepID=A0A067PX73_9AGAM|nr:hypothetical protein JAAARDRAFT_38030 [Jaapia argillacea MUCL 33604]
MAGTPSPSYLRTHCSLPNLHKPIISASFTDPHRYMHSPDPKPSPSDIQHHLYTSFLHGSTADVTLRIRGSWHALYKLHRVVLIQAGFFQSLFTAGFVESAHKYRGTLQPDEVEVVFDDPNITRAAFEICIARLYGGGPPLHICPSLIPTPSYPLTPSFSPSTTSNSKPYTPIPMPPGHQPATPRFLLSLLATSVYISIPSIATQALGTILGSVGPKTVMRYLGFAVGKGIGEVEGEGEECEGAAVGLENVAKIINEESLGGWNGTTPMPTPMIPEEPEQTEDQTNSKEEGTDDDVDLAKHLEYLAIDKTNASSESGFIFPDREHEDEGGGGSSSASPTSESNDQERGHEEMAFHYGAVSGKVGEAVACWLARWGKDILGYEQEAVGMGLNGSAESGVVSLLSPPPTSSRRRATTVPGPTTTGSRIPPSNSLPSSSSSSTTPSTPRVPIPVIWRRGGLDPSWIRALISSDFLFVKAERERYDLAKGVVEMRRRGGGVRADEEREWEEMFARGIYYPHMSFEDLMFIEKDVSPSTGRPYVPASVLQASHWGQSLLRHHIMVKPTTSTSPIPSTPPPRDKELGLTLQTSDILTTLSSDRGKTRDEQERPFYPIPGDSSVRIGDTTGLENASMDELFATPSAQPSDPKKVSRLSTSEQTFFGLLSSSSQQHSASTCLAHDSNGKTRWSPYPPFRFGVEFWDVDWLKEKSRLHSHTVWYAGSLFNVYVQVVRKKGSAGTPAVQLGVYLHRQSSVDPVPPASAPSPLITMRERERVLSNASAAPVRESSSATSVHSVGGISIRTPNSRSSTPVSSPSHPTSQSPYGTASLSSSPGTTLPSTLHTLPATSSPIMPPQPYRDPRASISAYFTISCPSATGASLTQFTSAPDVFSISQSWGWKSSSLRTEEYLEVGGGEEGLGEGPATKEVSLRATVVLGLV